jgi:uncharacterized protein (TIGR01777 family)
MNIVITGATGFIGRHLAAHLESAGHSLRLTSRAKRSETGWFTWDPECGAPPIEALRDADAIIHFAGEPVAQRWSARVKERIRASRVHGTESLVAQLSNLSRRPRVLVCSSAIGYYGSRGDEVLMEHSAPGEGFLPEVCVAWEHAAHAASSLGIRVVCLRTGVVLHPEGGALAKMLPAFRLGAGGPIADGRAWMAWIHLMDMVRLVEWAVENTAVSGPLNAVAPHPVENRIFTQALAGVLNRPAFFPVPAFALKLLFGEMAEVVLASQRVMPQKGLQAGFEFEWPELRPALRDLLS